MKRIEYSNQVYAITVSEILKPIKEYGYGNQFTVKSTQWSTAQRKIPDLPNISILKKISANNVKMEGALSLYLTAW